MYCILDSVRNASKYIIYTSIVYLAVCGMHLNVEYYEYCILDNVEGRTSGSCEMHLNVEYKYCMLDSVQGQGRTSG